MGLIAELRERVVIRRGAAWSPWPDLWAPGVSPGSLRPGVDWVRGRRGALAARGPGIWRGPADVCTGLVEWEGVLEECDLEQLMEGFWLRDPLHPDVSDFLVGYDRGRWEAERELEIGTKSKHRVPDWHGRGVRRGFEDKQAGRLAWPCDPTAFNETLRDLHARWPQEHPLNVIMPRRAPGVKEEFRWPLR